MGYKKTVTRYETFTDDVSQHSLVYAFENEELKSVRFYSTGGKNTINIELTAEQYNIFNELEKQFIYGYTERKGE